MYELEEGEDSIFFEEFESITDINLAASKITFEAIKLYKVLKESENKI